jgi:hypothetical protein
MPGLVRTPDRHRSTRHRAPDLKPSTSLSLQVAGLQEHATTPSKERVQLCWSGYNALSIHRRDPTTVRHGDFCLLRSRPRPVHPSLDNLVVSSSPRATILMPSLVRTPDRHRTSNGRTPDLKPSTEPGLQVAGLQEHATTGVIGKFRQHAEHADGANLARRLGSAPCKQTYTPSHPGQPASSPRHVFRLPQSRTMYATRGYNSHPRKDNPPSSCLSPLPFYRTDVDTSNTKIPPSISAS